MRAATKKFVAELRAPLPTVAETIGELNALAVKSYDTKARTKNAVKASHLALAELLQTLDAFSKHEELVPKSVVESIHRALRRRLKLASPTPTIQPLPELAEDLDG